MPRILSHLSIIEYLYILSLLVITDGSTRINGKTSLTGRVEFFYNGQWGTVCDDQWDINDAHVVCKQLGFPQASQAFSGATHGQGSGPIWLSNVACSGSELHLYDCSQSDWGNNSCNHDRDASVQCRQGSSVIRLAGGGANYGRVEIYEYGLWGTVCDDTWDINDANVTCRDLGYSGATSAPTGASYGPGSGPILRHRVYCQGSEASLLNCPFRQDQRRGCSHSKDSSVVCY